MTAQVYIDGQAGTTALQIADRLAARTDLSLIRLDDADRKDPARRRQAINDADVAILCLPDDAAREAVGFANNRVRILDASTAHRVEPGWTYGLPEYTAEQPQAIARSARVANPGCYPTGAILMLAPLVRAGVLPSDYPVTINAVSGYTGGGRKMIEQFENPDAPGGIKTAHRAYGLDLDHKHVPEIEAYGLLARRPIFMPSVARFPQGMLVQIPLHAALLSRAVTVGDVREILAGAYAGCTHVAVITPDDGVDNAPIAVDTLVDTDIAELHVSGNDRWGQIVMTAVLDNLGKGAAGAAVQNLDLMLAERAA